MTFTITLPKWQTLLSHGIAFVAGATVGGVGLFTYFASFLFRR